MAHHEIRLERRTLHGHFSRDLAPISRRRLGDSIAFACLNSGWRDDSHEPFEDRLPEGDERDAGHALIGPVEGRGAVRRSKFGSTSPDRLVGRHGCRRWHTPLNERLGVHEGEHVALHWTLDADAASGVDQKGVAFRCARSSASSACRQTSRASTRPRLRALAAATSTARSSSPNDALSPDPGRRGRSCRRRRARGSGRR